MITVNRGSHADKGNGTPRKALAILSATGWSILPIGNLIVAPQIRRVRASRLSHRNRPSQNGLHRTEKSPLLKNKVD
jgi:hypothetical protein